MAEPRHNKGRSKQDYTTPRDFLDRTRAFLGITEFDCDLAATAANAVCGTYYTLREDSLRQDWRCGDGWNWLNPPFENIRKWAEKAYTETHNHHGAQTCILVPAGVGSNWFSEWCHQKCQVVFLNGRLTFGGTPPNPKTGKPDCYPKDLMLLLYSRSVESGYDIWRWADAA